MNVMAVGELVSELTGDVNTIMLPDDGGSR